MNLKEAFKDLAETQSITIQIGDRIQAVGRAIESEFESLKKDIKQGRLNERIDIMNSVGRLHPTIEDVDPFEKQLKELKNWVRTLENSGTEKFQRIEKRIGELEKDNDWFLNQITKLESPPCDKAEAKDKQTTYSTREEPEIGDTIAHFDGALRIVLVADRTTVDVLHLPSGKIEKHVPTGIYQLVYRPTQEARHV